MTAQVELEDNFEPVIYIKHRLQQWMDHPEIFKDIYCRSNEYEIVLDVSELLKEEIKSVIEMLPKYYDHRVFDDFLIVRDSVKFKEIFYDLHSEFDDPHGCVDTLHKLKTQLIFNYDELISNVKQFTHKEKATQEDLYQIVNSVNSYVLECKNMSDNINEYNPITTGKIQKKITHLCDCLLI